MKEHAKEIYFELELTRLLTQKGYTSKEISSVFSDIERLSRITTISYGFILKATITSFQFDLYGPCIEYLQKQLSEGL